MIPAITKWTDNWLILIYAYLELMNWIASSRSTTGKIGKKGPKISLWWIISTTAMHTVMLDEINVLCQQGITIPVFFVQDEERHFYPPRSSLRINSSFQVLFTTINNFRIRAFEYGRKAVEVRIGYNAPKRGWSEWALRPELSCISGERSDECRKDRGGAEDVVWRDAELITMN